MYPKPIVWMGSAKEDLSAFPDEVKEVMGFALYLAVRLAGVVYVLHAFQKKSKRGIATPRADLDVIKRRLKRAEELHRAGGTKT